MPIATGKVACGRTRPGEGWMDSATEDSKNKEKLIVIRVDTSSGNFTTVPRYVCSLGGTKFIWATNGGSSVYEPTEKNFLVFVRRADGADLSVADAKQCEFHINWIGFEDK